MATMASTSGKSENSGSIFDVPSVFSYYKTQSINPFLENYKRPPNFPSPPPELGHQRTTFSQDLAHLDHYLSAIAHRVSMLPCESQERLDSVRQLIYNVPCDVERAFHIILYEYDERKPKDFEDMKNTAGMTEEHFEDIRYILYPGGEAVHGFPSGFRMFLDQLIGQMSIIEGMRDKGLEQPKFALGDGVCLKEEEPEPELDLSTERFEEEDEESDDAGYEIDSGEHYSRRTSFFNDVWNLYRALNTLSKNFMSAGPSPSKTINEDIFAFSRAVNIVLSYNLHDPEDLSKMKDGAGLPVEDFEEFQDKVYPNIYRSIEQVIKKLRTIQAMKNEEKKEEATTTQKAESGNEHNHKYKTTTSLAVKPSNDNIETENKGSEKGKDIDHKADSELGIHRTTFSKDLTHLHSILTSLAEGPNPAGPWDGLEFLYDGVEGKSYMMDRAFKIVLSYPPRKAEDWAQMQDTAGLSLQDFRYLKKKLYPNGRHGGKFEVIPREDFLYDRISMVKSMMHMIEGIRDEGMKPPRFWVDDEVLVGCDKGLDIEDEEGEGVVGGMGSG